MTIHCLIVIRDIQGTKLRPPPIGGHLIVGTILGVDIIIDLLDDLGERLAAFQNEVREANPGTPVRWQFLGFVANSECGCRGLSSNGGSAGINR